MRAQEIEVDSNQLLALISQYDPNLFYRCMAELQRDTLIAKINQANQDAKPEKPEKTDE